MKIEEHIPGFSIVLIISSFAYFLSTFHVSFGAPVISIIVGMLAGNVIRNRDYFEKGTEAAVAVFLPLGIALTDLNSFWRNCSGGNCSRFFWCFQGPSGLPFLSLAFSAYGERRRCFLHRDSPYVVRPRLPSFPY